MTDRASHRAAVEAGYAPLSEYVREFGTMTTATSGSDLAGDRPPSISAIQEWSSNLADAINNKFELGITDSQHHRLSHMIAMRVAQALAAQVFINADTGAQP